MYDLEVLIVGGGCHGVGLLHDLASRRIPNVHLVEEKTLSSGTSSRSTKLVHGGLRYLEHLKQWPLVSEALSERAILLRILKGLVQPLPFVLPAFKGDRPAWMLQAGLFIYDSLAGDGGLPRSRRLSTEEIFEAAPYLNRQRILGQTSAAFLYYDAQMLDDVIVRVAAEAAVKLGASYEENASVVGVEPLHQHDGFKVRIKSAQGERVITARTVVNAAGAWNNANLIRWGITPKIRCLLNQGSHLIFKNSAVPQIQPEDAAASLLQNKDGRVVFFIPWNGEWLLGTTESLLPAQAPRGLKPSAEEISYLLDAARLNLDIDASEQNIKETFAGVRTMPINDKSKSFSIATLKSEWSENPFASPAYMQSTEGLNISALSRETIIDETRPGLFSIYGGKYTTYRAECEKLGSQLTRLLKRGGQSTTRTSDAWFLAELLEEMPDIFTSSPSTRAI
ncbi:MAG: FAD-dependent oxidoreductase [Betaproteobacteria bacterium]|nr:FAD-dependent oxidoreductase [Betaproteobacteria bacterium]